MQLCREQSPCKPVYKLNIPKHAGGSHPANLLMPYLKLIKVLG